MSKQEYIAGVDEAGRGPLAGPVVAAAVILDPSKPIDGLMDSKKLTKLKREKLALQIKERALSWNIAYADVEEIDKFNILQASLLAMKRAVGKLTVTPTQVWIDGLHAPTIDYEVHTLIKGDEKIAEISAASILAKVERDKTMQEYHLHYPDYDFAGHKGYPTKKHIDALRQHGASPIHRRTFRPVAELL